MDSPRRHNLIDQVLIQFDQALRTCVPGATQGNRPSPAVQVDQAGNQSEAGDHQFSEQDRKHVAGLMRINHTGEVCAQALYAGQAATAKLDSVRDAMEQAASEETDHLAWCEQRLTELEARPSILNPAFYAMSFGIGALAGLAGDRWSLGFVAETEKQVCDHLEDHIGQLPETDQRSRAILEQMVEEEKHHGDTAAEAGGAPLPEPVRQGMKLMSQVMKKTTYHV